MKSPVFSHFIAQKSPNPTGSPRVPHGLRPGHKRHHEDQTAHGHGEESLQCRGGGDLVHAAWSTQRALGIVVGLIYVYYILYIIFIYCILYIIYYILYIISHISYLKSHISKIIYYILYIIYYISYLISQISYLISHK